MTTTYQSIKRICTVGLRHPRAIARLRVGIGIWLLFVMTVLYSTGHGGHWAWLLAVGTAVHWVWACFLFRIARQREADITMRRTHGAAVTTGGRGLSGSRS